MLAGACCATERDTMRTLWQCLRHPMCESFFATLECELLAPNRFKTPAEARSAAFDFIEGFYNPRRRHSSIGYLSPIDFERRHQAPNTVADARQPAAVLAAVKTSPSGGRKRGPSLTAVARDGRSIVQAGTEEWLRQGPN
jgi:hypothetical protein